MPSPRPTTFHDLHRWERERQLLASLVQCTDARRVRPVLTLIGPGDFAWPEHREVYEVIRDSWRRARRPPSQDELWAAIRLSGYVSEDLAWFDGLLRASPNDGGLEVEALDVLCQGRALTLRNELRRAYAALQTASVDRVVQVLEVLGSRALAAAQALRCLQEHSRRWAQNTLRRMGEAHDETHTEVRR
jgi:hypothetical protein